jgi:hypothetical protein
MKMEMADEKQKIRYELTTNLFSQREHRILDPCARPSPYLEDYFTGMTGDTGTVGVAFLMCHVDLFVEYIAMSDFFLGVPELFRPLLCELPF